MTFSKYKNYISPSKTLRHFSGLPFGSPNKRVSGSGFHPSPKSPSATSDTRKTLPKIFEPPFGLTPKILSCSLRLTKKSNRNKITKLRIAQQMLSEIFSQAETDIKENYARRGFSVAQKLSSLRSSPFGSCNRWICDSLSLVQICSASLRKLHISPKTLSEIAVITEK